MIKVIVFDSTRGFARHIKSKLADKFDIIVVADEKIIMKCPFKSNEVLVFIINKGSDLLLFTKLYSKASNVIIGVSKKRFEVQYATYEEVKRINFDLSKKDLMFQLENLINEKNKLVS